MTQPPPPPDALCVLRGHKASVSAVGLGQTANIPCLLSGDSSGVAKLWDLQRRRAVCSWEANDGGVLSAHILGTDQVLTHGRDQTVCVWDLGSGQPQISGKFGAGGIGFCRASVMDGRGWVALPDKEDGKEVEVWEIHTGTRVCVWDCPAHLPFQPGMVTSVCLRERGQDTVCVVGHEAGWVSAWVVGGDRPIGCVSVQKGQGPNEAPVFCVDWEGVDGVGVAGSSDASLTRFRVTDDGVERLGSVELMTGGVNDLAIRGDRRIYATAGWDGRLRVFSFKKDSPLCVFERHSASLQCVSFANTSAMGWLLAAGGRDNNISLWSVYNDV